MAPDRLKCQGGLRGITHAGDHTAMPPGRDIAARPGIALLDLPCTEHHLVLDDHATDLVSAGVVGPDPGEDVLHRLHDVAVAVRAELPVRPLRGVADDGCAGVDQQAEPVTRLLDVRASLQPDRAGVLATT